MNRQQPSRFSNTPDLQGWRFDYVESPVDGIKLRYGTYVSDPTVDPDKWIVFFNGRTEWIEKQPELAVDLLRLFPGEKLGFLTWDHRGQGLSEGKRAFVEDYSHYSLDAAHIIAKIAHAKPYSVVAHSMGGLIALYSVMTKVIMPECMVLNAPMLFLPNVPIPRVVSRPVASILCSLGFAKRRSGSGSHDRKDFAVNPLTHDEVMFGRICDCPYRVPSATFGWVDKSFEAQDFVRQDQPMELFIVPTKILSPSKEAVVDPAGIADWISYLPEEKRALVSVENIEGSNHESFCESEPMRSQAIEITARFIRDRL